MKRRLAILLSTMLVLGAGYQHKAQAAIPVIDMQNIAQAINTVTNTLTQIQNQLLELQPLDLQALQHQINGINQQMDNIQRTAQQAQGLLSQSLSMDQKWQQTFGNLETKFSTSETTTPEAQMAHDKNKVYTLEKTYQDAYQTAKDSANLENEMTTLQDLMDANKNAVGNKQSLQIQNSLLAQQNLLLMKQIKTLSGMSTAIAGSYAAKNEADAATAAQNEQLIQAFEEHQAKGNPASKVERGKL